MKTTLHLQKAKNLAVVVALTLFANTVFAQSGHSANSGEGNNDEDSLLKKGFKFDNPKLQSGTDLQKGAVYLFKDVLKDVDATLTVSDLVGGAKITKIDDNGSSVGYKDALQPEIKSGGIIGRSYAEFRISFFKKGTTTPQLVQNMNATALDIDGNLTLKEFADIEMGDGAVANYMGKKLLDISLLNMLLGKFRADNVAGIERDGIDTTAFANMYTASKAAVSSFVIRYGTTTLLPSTSARQFSMYMKGFTYPDQVTLPLSLVSFNAELNSNKVDLNWITGWEKNVSYFVVEKSTDGNKYNEAGVVFAKGNSTTDMKYTYSDASINVNTPGVVYYRLRSVDADAKVQISSVRMIRIGGKNEQTMSIITYPNPVTTGLIVTVPSKWQGKKISYEIMNNSGQSTLRTEQGSASQTENLNVSKLVAGFYIIRVTCNGEVAQQKIIKQ